jgi:hypothetical protein
VFGADQAIDGAQIGRMSNLRSSPCAFMDGTLPNTGGSGQGRSCTPKIYATLA